MTIGSLEPIIIPRDEHNISRANMSKNAVTVLRRLKQGGYEGFLVGGAVRDLLLGHHPKDFDVATDATPEQVDALFRNCRLIGRRFRLAHIMFGREIIEVATFRAPHDSENTGEREVTNGRITRDNVYGDLDDDVQRRDFTINALYYNIRDFSVLDYHNGIHDLQHGVLRLIGDTDARLREDPVRMLRAVRFAAKLHFRIDDEIIELLPEMAHLLEDIPAARLFEEMLKLFQSGYASRVFDLLSDYQLLRPLFPQTVNCLEAGDEKNGSSFSRMLHLALKNTDDRIKENKPVTPAFLTACFLWKPLNDLMQRYRDKGLNHSDALYKAGNACIREQTRRIAIPKRFSIVTREIWQLQARLERTSGKRPARLVAHPRFRAAYDFLLLRAESGEDVKELANWWTEYQKTDEHAQAVLKKPEHRKTRPRRRRPHNKTVKSVS